MSIFFSTTPHPGAGALIAASSSWGVGSFGPWNYSNPTTSELLISFWQASKGSPVPRRVLTASSSMDCRIPLLFCLVRHTTLSFRMRTTLTVGSARVSPTARPQGSSHRGAAATRRKSLRVITFSYIELKLLSVRTEQDSWATLLFFPRLPVFLCQSPIPASPISPALHLSFHIIWRGSFPSVAFNRASASASVEAQRR